MTKVKRKYKSYGSSKRPCIIVIVLFSRDHDITKVVDLNVKTVFSRRNCSYRQKIPHLVMFLANYGVRASG